MAKANYLDSSIKMELYHDAEHIDNHLRRAKDAQFDVLLKWKRFSFNRMFQRIGIDISVIVFVMYCIIASRIYGTTNGIILITCANYLKNIERIREFSRYYSELYLEYFTYTKICNDMSIPKTEQVQSFEIIDIPIQQFDHNGVKLSITCPISIQSNDIIIIDGPSGAGKSTFINLLTGMCASEMKVCINNKPNIASAVRSLCNVFNNNIVHVRNPSPNHLISCYGKFNDAVAQSVDIANISTKIESSKTSKTLSKGEFQRVMIAEMTARLMSSKQKQIAIWDEMTDGIEETLALDTIEKLLVTFNKHVTIIVTHSSTIRSTLLETHKSIKVLKVIDGVIAIDN